MVQYGRPRCANMNHGRANSLVNFCPSCGEKLRQPVQIRCEDAAHRARRKEQSKFCHDCGKDLSTLK